MIRIFSLFDDKACAYGQPFFSSNDSTASRAVQGILATPNELLARNPADFTLYCLGEFDEQTGIISANSPRALVNCLILKSTMEGV